MVDDVALNKSETIEKCLSRIAEEYQGNTENLRSDQTKQDAIMLNLERACQAAIDLAMHVVRVRRLGLPKESREAFTLLEEAKLISEDLGKKMRGLVGFRNTAIHNYRQLDLDIVEAVIRNHLQDFRDFVKVCLRLS